MLSSNWNASDALSFLDGGQDKEDISGFLESIQTQNGCCPTDPWLDNNNKDYADYQINHLSPYLLDMNAFIGSGGAQETAANLNDKNGLFLSSPSADVQQKYKSGNFCSSFSISSDDSYTNSTTTTDSANHSPQSAGLANNDDALLSPIRNPGKANENTVKDKLIRNNQSCHKNLYNNSHNPNVGYEQKISNLLCQTTENGNQCKNLVKNDSKIIGKTAITGQSSKMSNGVQNYVLLLPSACKQQSHLQLNTNDDETINNNNNGPTNFSSLINDQQQKNNHGQNGARHQPYPVIRPKNRIGSAQLVASNQTPLQNDDDDNDVPNGVFSRNSLAPSKSLPQEEVIRSYDSAVNSPIARPSKDEQRKIRNRQSAQLSRIRHKEMIDQMKRELSNEMLENDRLRKENSRLRQRLVVVEHENETLKRAQPGHRHTSAFTVRRTAGIATLSLFMFVTVQIGSLFRSPAETYLPRPIPTNHRSTPAYFDFEMKPFKRRALLSLEPNDYESNNDYDQKLPKFATIDSSPKNSNNQKIENGTLNNCDYGNNFNETKSILLNHALYSWVDRHEQIPRTHVRRSKNVPNRQKSEEKAILSPKIKNRGHFRRKVYSKDKNPLPKNIWTDIDWLSENHWPRFRGSNNKRRGKLNSNNGPYYSIDDVVKALKQRADTLYVVSVKDYLLLPATTRNSSSIPRISLIVPSLTLNGSLPNQTIMLRIECQVLATELLHLPQTLFPVFENTTQVQEK